MTQLSFRHARELSDALLFFARLENRELERDVEGTGHAEEYRTIVLSCQAIYQILVLQTTTNLLTTRPLTSYGDVCAYDASVEFVITEFGSRLETVRKERGISQTDLAKTMLPPNAPIARIRSKASWLSRIERDNENVSLDTQILLAKGLGFPSISAFWIAIERAGISLPSGLQSPAVAAENEPVATLAKVDPHAHSLPTGKDFERVIVGSNKRILEALHGIKAAIDKAAHDLLARGVVAREQPAASPRVTGSHRRPNSGKRTG